jgi:hypothetical protein
MMRGSRRYGHHRFLGPCWRDGSRQCRQPQKQKASRGFRYELLAGVHAQSPFPPEFSYRFKLAARIAEYQYRCLRPAISTLKE